jgi:DNA-binding LacI/PurR family transcriptional regulator
MKRATIAMIAAATGVSPATVSRALRGDPRISGETTDRIRSKANELDYASQLNPRMQAGSSVGAIGLVVGAMANPYVGWLLRLMLAEAARRGKRIVLLDGEKDILEDGARSAMIRRGIEGCVITTAPLSADMAQLLRIRRIPTVLMNRAANDATTCVTCDHVAGAARLADLVLDAGYRRIAMLRGSGRTTPVLYRERGFIERLEERSIGLFRQIVIGRDDRALSTYAAGQQAAELLLATPPAERPEAAFVVNDFMAMGVIDKLAEHGVRVPDDISIVGFDGIAEGERFPYRLTTIRQPVEELVRTALDCLQEENPGSVGKTVLLRGGLITRSSLLLPEAGQAASRQLEGS